MSLVTQTVVSLPVVVIVTDQPDLSLCRWLGQLFGEQEFSPQLVSPTEFASVWEQLQEEGTEIYRIILVTGFGVTLERSLEAFQLKFSSEGTSPAQGASLEATSEAKRVAWQQCVAFLGQQATIQPVAITAMVGFYNWQAPLSKHPFVTTLSGLSLEGSQLAAEIQTYLPSAQVFLGWDCLVQSPTSPATVEGIELPLLFSVLSAQARVLFDSQQTWQLQTMESFFTTIAQQLLKPHKPGWISVQGKTVLSQVWLHQAQELIDRYFAYRPTLVPVTLPESTSPQLPDIVCQTESPVEEYLDAQLRTLPHTLAQLDLLSEWAASNGKTLQWEPHAILAGLEQTIGQTKALKNPVATSPKSASPAISIPAKSAGSPLPQSLGTDVREKVEKELNYQEKKPSNSSSKSSTDSVTPNSVENLVASTFLASASLETELQQLFEKSRGGQRQERLQTKVKVTQKIVAKSKRHKTIFYLGATAAIVAVGVGVLWVAFQSSLLLAKHQWKQDLQDITRGKPLAKRGSWGLATPLGWQLKIYKPLLKDEVITEAEGTIELDRLARQYDAQATELTRQTGVLMTQVAGQQSLNLTTQIQQLNQVSSAQQETVNKLIDQLKIIDVEKETSDFKQQINQLTDQLRKNQDNLPATGQVLSVAPELLGVTDKKTYAVVIQDQREIRPTGGFIQAVGKLTFSQGMLTDHSFQSVYEIDNKLGSQVVPPDEVKRFLGESRWFLRDSNWNPDFPATAKQINFFLQDSTGRPVDGVIGLTLEGVRKLLQVSGPLDIPELNEQVTEKNLYDRLEFHAETKSVEVNGAKLDYTSLLLSKLVTRLATLDANQLAQLAAAWSQSLQSKDIVLASLNTPAAAKVWQALDWDGGVIQPTCPNQFVVTACLVDQLYQVDANVGVNKVNPYIEKQTTDHVEVGESFVTHRRTVTYRNQAKLDSWPQGQYLAYVKFLLGKTAEIQSLKVNGAEVSKDQLVSYAEQGSPIVGAAIQVGRQKTTVVELTYRLKLPPSAPFSYFFFNQKQPGVVETQDVLLSYRRGLRARLIAPQADLSSQLLNFHLQRDGHTFVGVTFESDSSR